MASWRMAYSERAPKHVHHDSNAVRLEAFTLDEEQSEKPNAVMGIFADEIDHRRNRAIASKIE